MKLSTLLAVLPLAASSPVAPRAEPAPLLIPRGVAAQNLVADNYIVKFREGSAMAALEAAVKKIPGDTPTFSSLFKGFSGKLNAASLALIRNHPDVEYVEQSMIYSNQGTVTQNSATWGLGRISHRQTGSTQYVYDDSAGAGTCSYIVDSGIDTSHPDFGGRAVMAQSFIGDTKDTCGHGTHVAGTVGSNTYGVAKKTNLYGVKVLAYNSGTGRCEGPNDGIIRGLDFVAQDAARRNCPNGVVVNMSLGGGYSQASNDAVAALVKKGYFVGVAAGNGDQFNRPIDASNVSPASEPSACTVAASDKNDRAASFTNYGKPIDITGPGVGVISTKVGGGTASMDGTSMATPHIVGLAAYFMGQGRSANGLCEYMQSIALNNQVTGVRSGTKNYLAQNDKSQ